MIIQSIREAYNNLSQKINQIEKYLEKAPEGYLKVRDRNHKYTYFHRRKDEKNKTQTHYLKLTNSNDVTLIVQLANKQYYKKLLPIIKKEHSTMKRFLDEYKPEEKYQIFDKLCDGRKAIICPAFEKPEMIIAKQVEKWKQEEWKQNKKYPEKLIYETDKGDYVRSKSEIIISNLLYANHDRCIYRYEAALTVHGITLYPDFTIMKIKTGEIYYWEHFGMMDDEEYVNKTLQKIKEYILAGIFPGKQLICTFESKNQPLSIKVVKELIKEYF